MAIVLHSSPPRARFVADISQPRWRCPYRLGDRVEVRLVDGTWHAAIVRGVLRTRAGYALRVAPDRDAALSGAARLSAWRGGATVVSIACDQVRRRRL